MLFLCMGFLFLGISISLGIIVHVVFDGPVSKIKSSYAFSLNETRTLDYSSVWCSSLSVEAKPYVDAAFYLLDEAWQITMLSMFCTTLLCSCMIKSNTTVSTFFRGHTFIWMCVLP